MIKKTAIITGASKRIGRSIALHLATKGFDIAIHYFQSSDAALNLKREIEDLGQDAKLFSADLACQNQCEELISTIANEMNDLKVLINSASIFYPSTLANQCMDSFENHIAINLKAPLILSSQFNKFTNNGLIINFTDAKMKTNQTEFFDYMISKKALESASKMAAVEFAPNLRVNTIAPGWIISPEYLKEDEDELLGQILLNKQGNYKDIVNAVEYLIENSYITGQTMYVDGGLALA